MTELLTGFALDAITIGIVLVAFLAAKAADVTKYDDDVDFGVGREPKESFFSLLFLFFNI